MSWPERARDNPVGVRPIPIKAGLIRIFVSVLHVLAYCRANLQRSSRRFRQIISSPEFEGLFGPAELHPKGGRQNIFGAEDELRVAPKGVDKTHKWVPAAAFLRPS